MILKNTIVTGDDIELPVPLEKNDEAVAIASDATIKAALVTPKHDALISAVVTQRNDATGADWANGIVVVEMSSAETAAITETGRAILAIQVDDGGKQTYMEAVTVVKGNID